MIFDTHSETSVPTDVLEMLKIQALLGPPEGCSTTGNQACNIPMMRLMLRQLCHLGALKMPLNVDTMPAVSHSYFKIQSYSPHIITKALNHHLKEDRR